MAEMPRPEQFRQTLDTAASSAGPAPISRWRRSKRLALGVAFLAGTVIAGSYGHDYWTTGIQRIPVRIAIDDRRATGLLRAGMSVEPAIDTRSPTSAD